MSGRKNRPKKRNLNNSWFFHFSKALSIDVPSRGFVQADLYTAVDHPNSLRQSASGKVDDRGETA